MLNKQFEEIYFVENMHYSKRKLGIEVIISKLFRQFS